VNKLVIKSYAKLNLYLEVINKRKDNYHNIKTVFERISLFDKITLKPRPDELIKIICKNPDVPLDNTNLCYQAARLLQEEFNKKSGLDIEIIKRIPVGAGLAGGSSNAASVLLGLNEIWELGLSRKRLALYARKIGADVAFFIFDYPFAVGSGRGDKIKALKLQRVRRFWHILIVPNIKASTALIYRKWDELKNLELAPLDTAGMPNRKYLTGLTKPQYDVKLLNLALTKDGHSLKPKLLFNSLEAATIKLYPQVARIKERLADLNLHSILMSGSGPAVYALVSSRKEAVSISRKLKGQERSSQVFVTSTR
jgi:4-diphosphocytidyl-2-C-methyl-D-erythritol kinase